MDCFSFSVSGECLQMLNRYGTNNILWDVTIIQPPNGISLMIFYESPGVRLYIFYNIMLVFSLLQICSLLICYSPKWRQFCANTLKLKFYTRFTLSSRAFIETSRELWMRWGTCEYESYETKMTVASITRRDIHAPLTRVWFIDMFPSATRRDMNRSRRCEMRWMYPSHSHSHRVSCCLDENINSTLGKETFE